MTAYGRGDYREKQVKASLERWGYVVWQTRGSHGAADIVALKAGLQPMVIQVKSGAATLKHYEWNQLYRLADRVAGIPVVVTMDGTSMKWRRIIGEHEAYSRDWPQVKFVPFVIARAEVDRAGYR
jgi:hypothetical protein